MSLVNIGDLELFERFLSLAAGRTGQILNYSSMANDCGISINPGMFNSLNWWCAWTGTPLSSAALVYGGSDYRKQKGINNRPWFSV